MRLHKLRIFGLKHWMVVAVCAAALTAVLPLLPENMIFAIVGIPLSFGVLIGGSFYGGLHANPPVVPVFAIACIVNAALWGGAFRLTRWGRRYLGQPKSFNLEIR
jgi:hypothetical protein